MNEVPQYWKSIGQILIGLMPLLIIAYGVFDCLGFFYYGEKFTELTISRQVHQINSASSGGIGALACLIFGILICHLFIR